jgi:hypothetical protein
MGEHEAADCTFVAKVYEEAGLLPPVDIPHYSSQAHLNRQAAAYLTIVMRCAKREIEEGEQLPGDLVMYHIARTWSHSAIVLDWPAVIHADLGAQAVIRAAGDQGHFDGVPRRFFSFW